MVILLVILVIAALVNGVAAFVYGSSKCQNEINLMLEPSIVKKTHRIVSNQKIFHNLLSLKDKVVFQCSPSV
jgi:hypothetical protein